MSDALNRKLAELLEPKPTFDEDGLGMSPLGLWGSCNFGGEERVVGTLLFHEDMDAAAALFEAALPRIAEKFGVTREEVHIDTRPRRDGTWYASFPWQLTHIGRTGTTIPESWRNAIAAALGVTEE